MSDPTKRFTGLVDNYAKYRPGYPEQVLDELQKRAGLKDSWVVADIGSGTGIFTKMLLENGNAVFAVEPNAEMRAAAEKDLAQFPGFTSVAGTAEASTLPNASTDMVTVAQAFHWFDPEKTRKEVLRILKPSGPVALLWNTRRIEGSDFAERYEALIAAFGTDYEKVRHNTNAQRDAVARLFRGVKIEMFKIPHAQSVDFDGLKGRLLSSSYIPRPGQQGFDAMLSELKRIFDDTSKSGEVLMEYDTEVFVGRPA